MPLATRALSALGDTGRTARLPAVRPGIFAVALMALLAAAGTLLQVSQSDAAHQLEDRFRLRMALGSGFVRSYLDDIVARTRSIAESELAAARVPDGALATVAPGLGFDVAVLLDADGRLIQVLPHRGDIIGDNLAQKYAHLRSALAGQPAVSSVVQSAAEGIPVLAIATPFDTPFGRRVISGGVPAAQTPLAAYLRASVPFTTADAYLVDAAGTVVASNGREELGPFERLDAELVGAISRTASGTYSREGTSYFFTAENVPGTPLRFVASVESENLYAPIHGLSRWLPWIVLCFLALVASYLLYVMRELGLSRARLQTASVELERSNRELRDFASIASHDLQEPLRKIQAFGDRLSSRAGAALDDESADYLVRMQDAAGRMQQLIQELLAYSRVATRPEEPTRVGLNGIIDEVLEDLEVRIRTTGGTVKVAPLPNIMASPLQMRQLFQNLIGNALKFHPEGVAPIVTVDAPGVPKGSSTFRITVSDNGIGFDEQYAERIFAPFQRLHARAAFEGTGMGLAICRRIVERHGGTLTAASTPGQGAVFTIDLPARILAAADERVVRKAAAPRRRRSAPVLPD